MKRTTKVQARRRGHDWENRIASALMLGHFISWREVFEFRQALGGLLDELVSFAATRPKDALPLFEIFIAGCLEKGNEIDDSGNDLGSLLDELACAWTRCCESAGIKAPEYLRKLMHWMDADDFGFFSDLEITVMPALGREYRVAFEAELKKRLDVMSEERPQTAGREQHNIDYDRHRAVKTLKELYTQTKNSSALIECCGRYGLDPKDCLTLADIFYRKNKLDRALEWAEKGLNVKTADLLGEYDLQKMRRKITRLVIHDVKSHTFFALIEIELKDGQKIAVDARPSDGIAQFRSGFPDNFAASLNAFFT